MTRDEALIAAFADELRSRRAALRLSREELAHRAGINQLQSVESRMRHLRGRGSLFRSLRYPTPRPAVPSFGRERFMICPA